MGEIPTIINELLFLQDLGLRRDSLQEDRYEYLTICSRNAQGLNGFENGKAQGEDILVHYLYGIKQPSYEEWHRNYEFTLKHVVGGYCYMPHCKKRANRWVNNGYWQEHANHPV